MTKQQIALYIILALIIIINMRKFDRNLKNYKKNNPTPGDTKKEDSEAEEKEDK